MTIKKAIVIQSHLSDALIEMSANPILATKRIVFVKHLLQLKKRTFTNNQLVEIWNGDN